MKNVKNWRNGREWRYKVKKMNTLPFFLFRQLPPTSAIYGVFPPNKAMFPPINIDVYPFLLSKNVAECGGTTRLIINALVCFRQMRWRNEADLSY